MEGWLGRSRKEGIIVYYEDRYRYKWCWRETLCSCYQ